MRADELRAAGLLSTGEDVSPEESKIGKCSWERLGMIDDWMMIQCQQTKRVQGWGWLRMSEVCDIFDCK